MKALDALTRWQKYLLAIAFFVVVLGSLWEKLVAYGIRGELRAITATLARQEARDNAIDWAYRDALCDMLGEMRGQELRNEDCEHFEGVTVILVPPAGAAEIEP